MSDLTADPRDSPYIQICHETYVQAVDVAAVTGASGSTGSRILLRGGGEVAVWDSPDEVMAKIADYWGWGSNSGS